MEGAAERVRIQRMYRTPSGRCWGYEARKTVDGSLILEGEVVREGDEYFVDLISPDGGRQEVGKAEGSEFADNLLRQALRLQAEETLDSVEGNR